MARNYHTYLCGVPSTCPVDDRFVHESMMGPVCVPATMSFRTGRAKGHRQRRIGNRYYWDGGCSGVLAGLLILGGHGG